MCFLAYIPSQKVCAHCKNLLHWEHFSADSRSPDGMLYVCKSCHSLKNKTSYDRNQTQRVTYARNRRSTQREFLSQQRKKRYWEHPEKERTRARESAQRHKERKRARHAIWFEIHRQEQLKKKRERYAANKEPWKKRAREHPEAIRLISANRRARKRALPDTFTLEQRQFMLQYWQYACAICGNEEGFFWQLSDDHWIPISSPDCPGTVAHNIMPLCHTKKGVQGSCNNSKHDKDPVVWLHERFSPRQVKTILGRVNAYFDIVRDRQVS
jgi:hypothetical protein